MKNVKAGVAAVAVALTLALVGCSATSSPSATSDVNPSGKIVPRQISWLLSRPADGSVITIMKELATDYAKKHPGFSLNLITTPDRPSYIQKYETLAAANKLPELFDADATPFTEQLAKQGKIVNAEALLKSLGLYNEFRPSALNYQRFDDGSEYMIPMQYDLEYIWYNKALFKKAGVTIPKTLADIPTMCTALRKAGITPIALDGQDGWPLERYISYMPFRLTGPSYITKLKQNKVNLSDATGQATVNWLNDLGTNKCFETGFSSQGYSQAQALFTSGQAAMYNIGDWEDPSLATTTLNSAVRSDVGYFTLPVMPNSATAANEFVTTSGIGMAVSSKTFDPLVRSFLKYALTNYYKLYAATGSLSPTSNVTTTVPATATPLYKEQVNEATKVGTAIAFPWDTQLDPTSNSVLQQDLVLLIQGDMTPAAFTSTIDSTIAQNAPKFFK
jgi:raffinose/stachyose/melibiose transport system substrate-binding protein